MVIDMAVVVVVVVKLVLVLAGLMRIVLVW
jgi:hypothetical protein